MKFLVIYHKLFPLSPAPASHMNSAQLSADLRVLVRIRPPITQDQSRLTSDVQETCVSATEDPSAVELRMNGRPWRYRCDQILAAGTPFSPEHMQPLTSLVKDQSGTAVVFAYGQTSSGKTFTIAQILEQLGHCLFPDPILNEVKTKNPEILLSAVELLGMLKSPNACRDLATGKAVKPMEDVTGRVQVQGLTEHPVTTAKEFHDWIQRRLNQRQTAATERNPQSSRSHALFSLRFPNDGRLWIIDLAGSESARDSGGHGDRILLEQSTAINVSLMCLRDCIRARQQLLAGQTDKCIHVPYRQSSLTFLLRDIFDPQTALKPVKCLVIGCVTPVPSDAQQTRNTLRYMQTLWESRVMVDQKAFTNVKFNAKNPVTWPLDYLKEWIRTESRHAVDPDLLCAGDCKNGLELLKLPESEFIVRCLKTKGMTEKRAKLFYLKFWKLNTDQRKREQEARMKPRFIRENWEEELLKRYRQSD